MKEAFIEALKEAGRVVVLAIIPVAIDSLGRGGIEWNLIWITGTIALLRFVDKFLHEQEKDGVAGGLVRF